MDKLKIEYCMIHGWEKKKGILIDLEIIDTSYDSFFVPEECKKDYYKEGEMWCHKEMDDEGVFDDDEIMDHIEDYTEKSFQEWKKIKLKLRKPDEVRT